MKNELISIKLCFIYKNIIFINIFLFYKISFIKKIYSLINLFYLFIFFFREILVLKKN